MAKTLIWLVAASVAAAVLWVGWKAFVA